MLQVMPMQHPGSFPQVLELVDLGHNSFDEIPAIAFNVLGDKVQTINLASCSIRTVQAGELTRFTEFFLYMKNKKTCRHVTSGAHEVTWAPEGFFHQMSTDPVLVYLNSALWS